MIKTAIIPVYKMSEDDELRSRSLLSIGGISVLERQLRQLKQLGIEQVIIITDTLYDLVSRALKNFHMIPDNITLVSTAGEFLSSVQDGEPLLLLEEGILMDSASMRNMAEKPVKTLAAFSADVICYGIDQAVPLSDGQRFASIAVAAVPDVHASLASGVKAYWESFLKRCRDYQQTLIDQDSITNPGRGFLWRPLLSEGEEDNATRALMRRAPNDQKDLISRKLHNSAEMMIGAWLNRFPLRTAILTLLSVALGLGTSWLMYLGEVGSALAMALGYCIFWGATQKVAFVHKTLQGTQGIMRLVDHMIEASWYLTLAWVLVLTMQDHTPWILMGATLLFAWAAQNQLMLYRHHTGRDLLAEGGLARWIARLGSNRTTRIWVMIVATLLLSWYWIPWVLAGYTALTFFMIQYRSA